MRKTSGIRLYLKSFAFLGSARKRYLLGVLLGSCELALLFAMPYVNQALIDIVTGERQGNILLTLLLMLGIFLLLVPPVIAGKDHCGGVRQQPALSADVPPHSPDAL